MMMKTKSTPASEQCARLLLSAWNSGDLHRLREALTVGWMSAEPAAWPLTGEDEHERMEMLATIADMSFDAHITFHLSESFAVTGDTQTALRLVEQAVERGFYPHDYLAVHCPFLAPLRGTAEFDRIVARAAERVAAFRA